MRQTLASSEAVDPRVLCTRYLAIIGDAVTSNEMHTGHVDMVSIENY